ncbi:hypothetical protein ACFL06_00775 [Patescibacteria group bacterium]
MGKAVAEQSNPLSVFWFKKQGYLDKNRGYSSGVITWSYLSGRNKSSVEFSLERKKWDMSTEETYLTLRYKYTNHFTGEIDHLDYEIRLATSPCNYGGVRYWFVCPYCNKRVGMLYLVRKYFNCRHCGKIAYLSQMRGGVSRGSSLCLRDVEKLEEEIKRYYYKDKPTRKHRRLIKMEWKLNNDFLGIFATYGNTELLDSLNK